METKPAIKSVGIWGSLIALLPVADQVLSLVGLVPMGVIPEAVNLTVGFVGAMLALYGRVKGTSQIKGIFK